MSNDELRERLRAKMMAPPAPPLEATRKFLRSYCSDAVSWDEIRSDLQRMAGINGNTLRSGLAGIEGLLSTPQEPGTLADLVAYEGNTDLDDPSDAGARVWLQQLADMTREILQAAASKPAP